MSKMTLIEQIITLLGGMLLIQVLTVSAFRDCTKQGDCGGSAICARADVDPGAASGTCFCRLGFRFDPARQRCTKPKKGDPQPAGSAEFTAPAEFACSRQTCGPHAACVTLDGNLESGACMCQLVASFNKAKGRCEPIPRKPATKKPGQEATTDPSVFVTPKYYKRTTSAPVAVAISKESVASEEEQVDSSGSEEVDPQEAESQEKSAEDNSSGQEEEEEEESTAATSASQAIETTTSIAAQSTSSSSSQPVEKSTHSPFGIRLVPEAEHMKRIETECPGLEQTIGRGATHCHNGGECHQQEEGHPGSHCICPKTYSGSTCSTVFKPEHDANDAAAVEAVTVYKDHKFIDNHSAHGEQVIITRHWADSYHECVDLCRTHPTCKSVNYGPVNGRQVCELLIVNTDILWNIAYMIAEQPGWTYGCCIRL